MDLASTLVIGTVSMTGIIAVASVINSAIVEGRSHIYNMAKLELDKAMLSQKRDERQQEAEIRASHDRGVVEGEQAIASAIHRALEAQKAPQVIVQR